MHRSSCNYMYSTPVHIRKGHKAGNSNNFGTKLKNSFGDEASCVKFPGVFNREDSDLGLQHATSHLGEGYGRKHEIHICEPFEEHQLGLKPVLKLQSILSQFSSRWKELEKQSDFLARKKQEDEKRAIESAQSVMPFEYEFEHFHSVKDGCNSLYPAERESVLHDVSGIGRTSEIKQEKSSSDEFISNANRKYVNAIDRESQLEFLLNKFDSVNEKLQPLQLDLKTLKVKRQISNFKLKELNREIAILEKQKTLLMTTLAESKEKENVIQNEIKHLLNQVEKLQYEIRQVKHSENITTSRLSNISNIENGCEKEHAKHSKEENRTVFKQHALQIQLLQDIHKEELHLYKLQLAQAAQQIRDLEAEIEDITKKQVVKQQDSKPCLIRNSSLTSDGTGFYKRGNNGCATKRRINISENEDCFPRDLIDHRFQLEPSLRSLTLNHFDNFKQELLNLTGEEVKNHVSSVDGKLGTSINDVSKVSSVENSYEELKNVGDKQEHTGYSGDLTLCDRRNTLDCGTGMAYNFYYGYLKLILPADIQISTLGIKSRIFKYMEAHHLSDNVFPVKKLLILIPQKTYVPTNLKELSLDDPVDGSKYWIEPVKALQPEVIVRNGWKRTFHHSVYKVKNPYLQNEPGFYVVAEFATPLKVFYDIIHTCPVPKISEEFKVNQENIISYFHKSLLERMRKNNDGCRDLCEVIYYPDIDKNGKRVNIGRVILDRIRSMSESSN